LLELALHLHQILLLLFVHVEQLLDRLVLHSNVHQTLGFPLVGDHGCDMRVVILQEVVVVFSILRIGHSIEVQ